SFHNELINSCNLSNASSGVSSCMHLKCFLGQLTLPICVQGRQVNVLFTKIKFLFLEGVKPNSLIVDRYNARTGTFTARAACSTAESLHTTARNRLIS